MYNVIVSYSNLSFRAVINSADSIRSLHSRFDSIREQKLRCRFDFQFDSISYHMRKIRHVNYLFLHKQQLKSPVTASMLNNIHRFGLDHRVINSYDDNRVK